LDIAITPELARQIFALVVPEDMHQLCLELDKAKFMARLEALERAYEAHLTGYHGPVQIAAPQPAPVDAVTGRPLTPEQQAMMDSKMGDVDPRAWADWSAKAGAAPVDAGPATFAPGWICPHCDKFIPGGQYHDCKGGLLPGHECERRFQKALAAERAATPPADDAGQKIYDIMRDKCEAGEYVENHRMHEFARAILAAIRRGEVPGIWSYGAIACPECLTFKARVAELERHLQGERDCSEQRRVERDQYCAELAEAKTALELADKEAQDARESLKKCGANAMLIESVPLSSGVNHLGHELARIKGELAEERNHREKAENIARTAAKQRDEARAELAALKGRKVKLPGAVGVFIEDGKPAHGMENGGRYLIKTDVIRMLAAQGVEVEQ
jgi:hypothetical protein